jgi:methylated-DNA-[protein]-cysteine S-methyltransferase
MSAQRQTDNEEIDAVLRRALLGGDAAGGAGRVGDEASRAASGLLARAELEGLVDVAYTTVDSPLGPLLAAGTEQGLVRLAFPEESHDAVLADLARRLSPRVMEAPARLDPVRRELEGYFAGRLRSFEVGLDWSLIEGFARRVLQATAAIPFGGVSSYGEVAGQAGSPRGSRAAGNALGANPIPIVIPCHRVLRAGGALGGYAGGPERKRWLLRLEEGSHL